MRSNSSTSLRSFGIAPLRICALAAGLAAACSAKTAEEEVAARRERVEAMLDVLDAAMVRTDEQKAADLVDADTTTTVPSLPDDVMQHWPLAVLRHVRGISVDETSPPERCRRLLAGLGLSGESLSLTAPEVVATLEPCASARYVELIEYDKDIGQDEYQTSSALTGESPRVVGALSQGGTLEIFEVRTKKRIVSLKFRIHEPLPSVIHSDELRQVDEARMYRAAEASWMGLLNKRHASGTGASTPTK